MTVLKCKMCGGDLKLMEGASTAECEYCGSLQTIPKADDEKKLVQFERAERLRKQCEFDKAAGIYETIVADFRQEAEAYWGLVLCKYGIEYVDDPATGKKIPTCHRSSFDSVMADSDFEQALENADVMARKIYREEAKVIEEIRKGIIAVSSNEEPYDIFICYKETDENGDRTLDSVLAQDVYNALTDKGYRVFFSRITLEEKLGVEYEPYIFAALNSAKIMLAFGTDYAHFNTVWVKNEWSRFLKLMAKDTEKHLIPCFKGIAAYDMPREFAKLQAQDMGKVGAIQDLLRGIEKIMPQQTEPVKGTVVVQQTAAANTAPLLKRAFMFLEDGDWTSANEYFEKVLDMDPECAKAYLGKLMAELRAKKQEKLKDCEKPFSGNNNYQKAIRFADDSLKATLTGYIDHINTRNEIDRKDGIYRNALEKMGGKSVTNYKEAIRLFESIPGWRDADKQIDICQEKLKKLKIKAEAERLALERQAEIARQEAAKKAKQKKIITGIVISAVCAIAVVAVIFYTVIIPNGKYNDAVELMESGEYIKAISAFKSLDGYKDSDAKITECEIAHNAAILDEKLSNAIALMEDGKYTEAIAAFEALNGHKDRADKIAECKATLQEAAYNEAVTALAEGNPQKAAMLFGTAGDYKDAQEQSLALWDEIVFHESISAGLVHTVGLKADGTVVAAGNNNDGQCNVDDWKNIVAISVGDYHTVGLETDGTVVAAGYNHDDQCNISEWQGIVAISAGDYHTVGLESGGAVVAVGSNNAGQCDVSGWQDIVAISAGVEHTVGLKRDGTVVAVGNNVNGQCDVSGWQDIVAISAGDYHTVGLKADGTVVAVGYNGEGQCDVSGWLDIIAISAGEHYTVGLKSNGTAVAVGYNDAGQRNISDWKNIVAISAGSWHTAGLESDGTVVAVGYNGEGQCDVSDWTNIKVNKESP